MASASTETAPSQSSQNSCGGQLIPSRSMFDAGPCVTAHFGAGYDAYEGGCAVRYAAELILYLVGDVRVLGLVRVRCGLEQCGDNVMSPRLRLDAVV